MKIPATLLLLALATFANAQSSTDGAIKATVTMLTDGRQKNTVVNPETRTSEETITDRKGKLISKTVYDLDDRGLPHIATFFDGKGKQLYKAEYQRDGADRIIGESYSSMNGQSLGRRVYTYSPGGRKVTRVDAYDANGNLVTPQKPAGPGRPDRKR
jgi:hypothetical protein